MAGTAEHHVLGGHLKLSVVSPEGTLFEGPVDLVVAPGHDGEVGFLPRHAPYVGLLQVGELRFHVPSGGTRHLFLAGGVVQVVANTVVVLCEGAITDQDADPAARFATLAPAFAKAGLSEGEARRRFERFQSRPRAGAAAAAHA